MPIHLSLDRAAGPPGRRGDSDRGRRAVEALRSGGRKVRNSDFDAIWPGWARCHARVHFTPVSVARRAAELLVARPGARILDVGSGAGKFCLVGALTTSGVFTGVERRRAFVELSSSLAAELDVPRVSFRHADVSALSFGDFDGVYLFNPFGEHVVEQAHIDGSAPVSHDRFKHLVGTVLERLEGMARGSRVVTYHGFGAQPGAGWILERSESFGDGPLTLWLREEAPGLRKPPA